MRAAFLLVSVLASSLQPQVTVHILESRHPQSLRIGRHVVAVIKNELQVDGSPRAKFTLPAGHWKVEGSSFVRIYDGALTVTSVHGALDVWLRTPIESYVAGVVAAESAPGTPRSALEALAVVVRSYALASRAAPLCDLAHCQVFQGVAAGQHGVEARAGAESTAGKVLHLWDGSIAAAPFHASCGGHTADPKEVFGGAEKTGARATADLDERSEWRVRFSTHEWRAAERAVFNDPLLSADAVLVRGEGGRVVQLALADGRVAAGDAFVRALDRSHGRGVVQSAAFDVQRRGEEVLLVGSGHGHGVGLCQAGSAVRAARGDGFEAILKAYFPAATLSR